MQQKTELQEVLDELWELMQIPEKNYSRVKQLIHCGGVWRMKNNEGKDSGALQDKVWNLGRLQSKGNEHNPAYGQHQTRVWDLGKMNIEGA